MKKWLRLWPFLIALLMPIFNVETVTVTMLALGVKSYHVAFPVCASVGAISLIFWYRFSRWCAEEVDLIDKLIVFLNDNFRGWFWAELALNWIYRLNKDNDENKNVLARIETGGKIVGSAFVFVAACNPIPFLAFVGWFPSVIVCGWIRWQKGLLIMMTGDVIKNAVVTYLWLTYGPQLWHIIWSHIF